NSPIGALNNVTGSQVIINRIPKTKSLSFTKIWRDAVGVSILPWPSNKSIMVTIKQDDNVYATYTISHQDLTVGNMISASGEDSENKQKLSVKAADPSVGYTFALTGLPYGDTEDGYSYYVSEEAVDGYQPAKYMDSNGIQALGANQIGNNGRIYNDQIGAALPSTGGSGTTGFYVVGAAMICTFMISPLILRRRKRMSE
ncbi:MAG: LPXTG cell wall anchor domain-containing protein, partial [Clostridia bacterium]|nr:LPXTG cell wall anchor domain-containing protein [Clostridia bacterium]